MINNSVNGEFPEKLQLSIDATRLMNAFIVLGVT